jgi:dolichol-phosphate mannosyltransferase
MKLSIVIPCYNEVDNVSKLRNELLPVIEELVAPDRDHDPEKFHSAELIFVDDGSRDETHPKLKECFRNYSKTGLSFKFLRHKTNRGLGAAIRTGFSHAEGEIILTVDSDGTYKFSEIPTLLACLTSDVDIVTASAYHPGGGVIGVPAYRLVLSKGSSFLYRILVNWRIHTYTCLFRAYRAEVVKTIKFESDGFLAGTELLIHAILRGYQVAEFPAVLHRRVYGVSKARILQTILSHLKFQGWVLLYRLQSSLGRRPQQRI